MKKIAIIGRGTAGCLTAAHFNQYSKNSEIEWYYDPNINPQAVGEGSLVDLPLDLANNLEFNLSDLNQIDGTIKTGIRKLNWGSVDSFEEYFLFGKYGMHFNAVQLQNFILEKIVQQGNIKIVESNVKHDQVDADHIIDCSGFPTNYDDYHISEFIPVNSAYVTQCFWDHPRFNHTLTIARPNGWVFGIPLKNRCAIGYMYNSNISTLDEIKLDVQNVFDQFSLVPSDKTNHLNFKNYFKKVNFTSRVSYNGNASLFLEPIEATTIAAINKNKRLSFDLIYNNVPVDLLNNLYTDSLNEIETIIMFHYFLGSKFNTPFWDFAKDRANTKIKLMSSSNKFKKFINDSKHNPFTDYSEYGTWDKSIMHQNIKAFDLSLSKIFNQD